MPRSLTEIAREIRDAFVAPQPIVRLELIRILAPLAILAFMASRIAHTGDWLSTDGFRVPSLDDDWRQPATLPGLAPWVAYALCGALVVSGVCTALGAFTRWASAIFAVTLAYVALADRLSAFTVSKLGPMIALALCLSPAGARYSIDAWRRRRRDPAITPPHRFAMLRAPAEPGLSMHPPSLASWGCVRFFQVLLPVFYFSSGLCKAHGDWLSDPYVLWTHVHDSYQTWFACFLGNHLPARAWTILQAITLAFELGAPLWLALRWTRPYALIWAVAMHAMIGLMFGPVIWFSLLMIALNIAAYVPHAWLERVFAGIGARAEAITCRVRARTSTRPRR